MILFHLAETYFTKYTKLLVMIGISVIIIEKYPTIASQRKSTIPTCVCISFHKTGLLVSPPIRKLSQGKNKRICSTIT